MTNDISECLDGWQYDPDRVSVRTVKGDDGREIIQLRLDLGLLQMELDGRPDGCRIHSYDSWFDHYNHAQLEHQTANPNSSPFRLESEDCANLLREAVQYHHRYLSFWHLGRYELCARDTRRNLRLFAFVREYARHQRDKLQFDQWRPYVTLMHARAVATPLAELEEYNAAIGVVNAGIANIEKYLEDCQQADRSDQNGELKYLKQWREELLAKNQTETSEKTVAKAEESPDPIIQLRQELDRAVAEERYEDAARLRDQLDQSSH